MSPAACSWSATVLTDVGYTHPWPITWPSLGAGVPGSTNNVGYNHYSLLRSVEDVFGLAHLGYAGQAGLKPFGRDVYNRP